MNRRIEDFLTEGRPFGFVMRSLPMLCVDIDGKNGGTLTSRIMKLPVTLAETSKSGNGYHLFYRIPEAEWNPYYGYDEFPDVNGLMPGVDIRSTGIVYHYPSQRWNSEEIAEIPPVLRRLMKQRAESREIQRERAALNMDEDSRAIAIEQTLESLARKLPAGTRNKGHTQD